MEQLERMLRRLRKTLRSLLAARDAARLAVIALAALAGVIAVDWLVHLPGWMRTGVLACGASALVWKGLTIAREAAGFRPRLTDLALRVERTPAGRGAGLVDMLASALELGRESEAGRLSAETAGLARRVIEDARDRVAGLRVRDMADARPAMRWALAACAAAGAVVGAGLAAPMTAGIGLRRALTPWGDAAWPRTTWIEDATTGKVFARGRAVELSAVLLKGHGGRGGGGAAETRVEAYYRVAIAGGGERETQGGFGPTRRVILTDQEREGAVVAADELGVMGIRQGALLSRLIEAEEAVTGTPGKADELVLEYWFVSRDDRTEASRARLVVPPEVVTATLGVTPPAYAVKPGTHASDAESRVSLLSPGEAGEANEGNHAAADGEGDTRGSTEGAGAAVNGQGVLAGSRVALRVRLNRSVPGPEAGQEAAWARRSLGEDAARLVEAGAELRAEGSSWELAWTQEKDVSLAIDPRDEHGIGPTEAAYVKVRAVADEAAQAAVVEPGRDGTFLATAWVGVKAEGRDDVGLAWIEARVQVHKRMGSASGGDPERDDAISARSGAGGGSLQPLSAAEAVASARPEHGEKEGSCEAVVRLADLNVSAGDEVWVYAAAADRWESMEREGDAVRRREATLSTPRKLRIVSESQFTEQVWSELAAARRAAMRVASAQRELKEAGENGPGAERETARQNALTDALAELGRALEQTADRVRRNGLDDAEVGDALASAGRGVREASVASSRASASLDAATRAENEDARERAREDAGRQQEAVEAEMERLAASLDRGQDAWAVKRTLERLAEEQASLKERFAQAAEKALGRTREQLTPGQRGEMDALAQEQEALARRAASAVDQLSQRAAQIEKRDALSAESLRAAQRTAQDRSLTQRLEDAAEAVRENQASRAAQAQNDAQETLEEMLEQAGKGGGGGRDAALRRVLANLVASLDGLIAHQKADIDALAGGAPDGGAGAADASENGVGGGAEKGREWLGDTIGAVAGSAMRLNANTLAALEQTRAMPGDLGAVTTPLSRASGAQQGTISALRGEPADTGTAKEAQARSLDHLTRAREEAGKLDREAQDRERDRKKTELKRAYEALAARQEGLQERAAGIAGMEAGRRARALARDLSAEQRALRTDAAALLEEHPELAQTPIIVHSHDRIGRLTQQAATRLSDIGADAAVTGAQASAARILKRLAGAFQDTPGQKQDEFREDADAQGDSGGGGGSSGEQAGLVSAMAQLRMLRDSQEDVLGETRAAAEGAMDAAGVKALAEEQRTLAEEGKKLLESLATPGGGGGGGGGGLPGLPPTNGEEDQAAEEGDEEEGTDGG